MTMDLQQLLVKLQQGSEHGNSSLSQDYQHIALNEDKAYCIRRWHYDDYDMNEDQGDSRACIKRTDLDSFLEQVLREGKGERTFTSSNQFRSYARNPNGGSEDLGGETFYDGQVKVTIAIENEDVRFRFVPSVQTKPSIRLERERDYL